MWFDIWMLGGNRWIDEGTQKVSRKGHSMGRDKHVVRQGFAEISFSGDGIC